MCALVRSDLVIRDLGSANGTFVNGKKLVSEKQRMQLRVGDKIKVLRDLFSFLGPRDVFFGFLRCFFLPTLQCMSGLIDWRDCVHCSKRSAEAGRPFAEQGATHVECFLMMNLSEPTTFMRSFVGYWSLQRFPGLSTLEVEERMNEQRRIEKMTVNELMDEEFKKIIGLDNIKAQLR